MLTRPTGPPAQVNNPGKHDAIITQAGRLISDGPLKSAHLARQWAEVGWNKVPEQRVSCDAEAARDGSNRIHLFPSLTEKSAKYAAACVLREFGTLLFQKSSVDCKRRWSFKLSLPSEAQIDAVQGRLNPQFKTYREMVESFKTAVDRYVALNIANALIAKGVPYPQCQSVNLKQWGATQEYANRRRFHVLIPLASAYSSRDIFDNFGAAFADWLAGTNGITETSVAEAVHGIVRDIVDTMR